MRSKFLALIFLFLLSFVLVMNAYAEENSIVSGTIEGVKGNTITVGGNSYSIYLVPLLDPSGNKVSVNHLTEGKRVEIFFKNKDITSVVVYEKISDIINDENIPK
ncbi:MAG: hypothetical protein A2Z50_02645 [Nitrospirae bacterium RBG_19FT_COMBO_42_15]|nr:MAG: hypothetical protein A2Z50_02645 [Nitrospirae bacterium RBG_19FT_COMBO_42_15]